MIEGLRLLPWVYRKRDEIRRKQSESLAKDWANCSTCLQQRARVERANWGCGFLPADQRTGILQHPEPAAPRATVCVGYSTSLPLVTESARAYGWRVDGCLREYLDGEPLPEPVKDYIDIYAVALKQVEAHAVEEAGKPKGGSHG